MDRLYRIRRSSREMSLSYVPGDCDICHQQGVRVRRMTCGRHNYCRMCVEFVPRLVNGDFSCKTCSEKNKTQDAMSRDRVEQFYSKQAGIRKSQTDMTVTTDGSKFISFEDTKEDNDLDGNNVEWDFLLEPGCQESKNKVSTDLNCFGASPERNDSVCARAGSSECGKIPKKQSYIRLVLPSAEHEFSDGHRSTSNRLPISNNVTQLIDAQSRRMERNIRYSPEICSSGTSCSETENQHTRMAKPRNNWVRRRFEQDPTEEERGTSPCKGLRSRSCISWSEDNSYQFGIEESPSEIERIKEEIGDIEGPQFSSGSSASCSDESRASANKKMELFNDDFWD